MRLFTAPLLLACALAAVLALELFNVFADGPDLPEIAMVANFPPPSGAAPAQTPVATGAELAMRILARPLFSPNRRPLPSSAVVAVPRLPLPRIAGVLVSPGERHAIFAPPGSGKPVVVIEGERIGDAVVQRIEAGRVTVLTPDGERVLRPTFDPDLPPRPTASAAAPGPVTPGQSGNLPALKVPDRTTLPIPSRLLGATGTRQVPEAWR